MNQANAKPATQSKTLIFNFLVGVFVFVNNWFELGLAEDELVIWATLIANLVLRFWTKQPVKATLT